MRKGQDRLNIILYCNEYISEQANRLMEKSINSFVENVPLFAEINLFSPFDGFTDVHSLKGKINFKSKVQVIRETNVTYLNHALVKSKNNYVLFVYGGTVFSKAMLEELSKLVKESFRETSYVLNSNDQVTITESINGLFVKIQDQKFENIPLDLARKLFLAEYISHEDIKRISITDNGMVSEPTSFVDIFQPIEYLDSLVNILKQHKHLSVEKQKLLLKELWIRFKETDTKLRKNEKPSKLSEYLSLIDDKTILKMTGIPRLHKYELLNLKNTLKVIQEEDMLRFSRDSESLGKERDFELKITNSIYHEDDLIIYATLMSPLQKLYNPIISYEINNEICESKLFESSLSYVRSRFKVSSLCGIKVEIPRHKLDKGIELSFWITTDKNRYKVKKLSIDSGRVLVKENKTLDFSTMNGVLSIEVKKECNPENKKNVWLYADNSYELDNAFLQFVHDISINDGIKRYYLFDSRQLVHEQLQMIPKSQLILKHSEEHKQILESTQIIFTSFMDESHYMVNKNEELVSTKIVYLGHGILHATLPRLYARERTSFDYFVTSSDFETRNLIEKYHYDSSMVIELGVPRYDIASDNNNRTNKILYAPTWRSKFTKGLRNGRWEIDAEYFLNSEFFCHILLLIENKQLLSFLRDNDLKLEIKLHPNLEIDNFFSKVSVPKEIMFIKEVNHIAEYKVFITDYSSFVFDFVNIFIPVVYFLTDEKEFLLGNHSYNHLDLPLSKGFGDITTDPEKLLVSLQKLSDNNWEILEDYLPRYTGFIKKSGQIKDDIYDFFIMEGKR